MRRMLGLLFGLLFYHACFSQLKREDIYSDFVLYPKRVALEKDLRERLTAAVFTAPLDSNSEYKYELACQAVTQFLLVGPSTVLGFDKLFLQYDSLQYDTKQALLESAYATYPKKYAGILQKLLDKESNPKLFALCALYLFRTDTSVANANSLKIRMVEHFPGYDSLIVLNELQKYLSNHTAQLHGKIPDLSDLFSYRAGSCQKTIYSFQRWDRNYPGLAVVQNADGSFVRDANGRLEVFEQLARSGSDLPYFISNGSTPQGIFRITGMAVSRNHFIGPTPNLQLIMPFEESWGHFFPVLSDTLAAFTGDSLVAYEALLPSSWRNYTPLLESWFAGKAGRTEIIAHGSTLDPDFFKDRPFYPFTPTQGCLCAKELWNPTTGHPLVSEQLNLAAAFRSTPGTTGYLFVINVDDQHKPVTRAEVENWVRKK